MKIWKLIAHHATPDQAIAWSIANGRIAVGWGRIGDLRELRSTGAHDISLRIKDAYPEATNAHTGGPSLWNFFSEMQLGDLVIVAGGGRRFHVAEVTGQYIWASPSDSIGDYQHQRLAVVTEDDPDELWSSVGSMVAEGQSTRWTVSLCSTGISAGLSTVEPHRYSEGSRYDILASAIERNPKARRACIKHHGYICAACGFDFEESYGDLGHGFIHVHHLYPFADTKGERLVDPVSDLIPLCPNCHAMVHRHRPLLSVEQLKQRFRS